jgi:hypothetical protein
MLLAHSPSHFLIPQIEILSVLIFRKGKDAFSIGKMAIKKEAWPAGVPQDVKNFMEEFYHLSNASSTHNQHEGDKCFVANPLEC